MRASTHIAAFVIRAWTRVYTWKLPPDEKLARRAEIESDLWEQLEGDPRAVAGPIALLARLVLGIRNDLAWRLERTSDVALWSLLTFAFATAALAFIVVFSAPVPPDPPPAPKLTKRSYPRPLPPPPPPCNPPALPQIKPCTPF